MNKNKGKQVTGIVIIFFIAVFLLLSLFLWDSSRIGEGNIFALEINEDEQLFGARYIKRIDGDLYTYDGPMITDTLVDEIMDIGGVKKASLGTKVSVLMETINFPGAGTGNWDYELQKKESSKRYGAYYGAGYTVASTDKYNLLRGYNDTELADYFRTGALKLVEGSHITDEDGYKVLISKELAEQNGFSLGSTFTTEIKLYDSLMNKVGNTVMEIELEVAGIFEVKAEQNLEGYPLKEDMAVNFMFVNNKTVREFDQIYRQVFMLDEEEPAYTSAEFFVGNPLRLNNIMKKAEKEADSTYFKAVPSAEIDDNVAIAYQKINKVSMLLVGWFVVAGCILLVLLSKKRFINKKSVVGICASLLLATVAAFVVTPAAGNVMLKIAGVEKAVEEEKDPMELPVTEKERREYYETFELRCNVIETGTFNRDVSVMTIIAGEVILILMSGLAVVLGKKK